MSLSPTWPDGLQSDLARAAPLLRARSCSRAPGVVGDALAAAVPGCDWACVVFPVLRSHGRVDRPFRDATTHPVLLGVLAAESTARSGPVRHLRRRGVTGGLHLSDARADTRWPEFGRQLATHAPGVGTLAVLPIEVATRGVVILAARHPHALDEAAARLETLTAPVEMFLRLAWAESRAHQLRGALDSHQVIGTATGMVMATDGLRAPAALDRLRRAAQTSGRPLHEVAAELVAGRQPRPGVTP